MYHTAAALTNKLTYNMWVKKITIFNTILKHERRKSDCEALKDYWRDKIRNVVELCLKNLI